MYSKEQTPNDQKKSTTQSPAKTAAKSADIATQQTHSATAIQRADLDPKMLSLEDALHLQRTIGNRAVGRLMTGVRPPTLQLGRERFIGPKKGIHLHIGRGVSKPHLQIGSDTYNLSKKGGEDYDKVLCQTALAALTPEVLKRPGAIDCRDELNAILSRL
jgi:hypothetical protein